MSKPENDPKTAGGRFRLALLLSAAVIVLLGVWIALRQTRTLPTVLDLGEGVIIDLVQVPAGSFLMGSPDSEADRDVSEGPQRVVMVQPFYMGKFEVTQQQWQKVMGYNAAAFSDNPLRPVEQVSWEDAMKFCRFVSERTGRKVRLPSEAEWEYACRAGTTTPFFYGATLTDAQACFDASQAYGDAPAGRTPTSPEPVGRYPANAFGLHDMHGNVSEWCLDAFRDNYAQALPDARPVQAAGEAVVRVYRGGSWQNGASSLRSAMRFAGPEMRTSVIGFRVVVE